MVTDCSFNAERSAKLPGPPARTLKLENEDGGPGQLQPLVRSCLGSVRLPTPFVFHLHTFHDPDVAFNGTTADPTTIAVLACLQFADQLRLARNEIEELRQRKDGHSGEYAAMLDRLIASVEELGV